MTTVLHVCEPTVGGAAAVMLAFVRGQVDRGWQVVVAAPDRGDGLRERVEHAGARYEEWEANQRPGPTVVAETRALSRIVARSRPHVAHLHSSKAGLVGRLLLRGRVPTIFQPHAWSFYAVEGTIRRLTLQWERIAARWAHALVCVSEDERENGVARGVAARYHVIPNGVDLSAFHPVTVAQREEMRAELGLKAGPIAVCVGRLHRQKGHPTLLDAWEHVVSVVGDAQLLLVGDGPNREDLEAQATGLRGVTFLGDRGDVRGWLAAADIAVQPSKWEAGVPLSVLEAMATCRSVVASDTAGMRVVETWRAGAVVPYGDAPALAREMLARLRNRESADDEGLRGRELVEARYDLKDQLEANADLTMHLASYG